MPFQEGNDLVKIHEKTTTTSIQLFHYLDVSWLDDLVHRDQDMALGKQELFKKPFQD